ncbi:MAG TPA: hypothetical protein VGL37_08370 [Solirubrobacteraceae bacterium]
MASSDAVTGIVGAAASFVGLIVGAFVTLKVARDNQKSAQQVELARALAGYMQATQLVAMELASMPKPTRFERQLDRMPSGRGQFFFNRLLSRVIFGKRHDELRDRYHRASAEVILAAPIPVIDLVREIDDLFSEWEQHPGASLGGPWHEVRRRLRLTAQKAVDEARGHRGSRR